MLPYNFDRIRFNVTTTGTGAVTAGSAVTGGFFSPLTAGLPDQTQASYVIEDANGNFEYGLGTYTASGTTFSRATVLGGTSGTSPINLSGTAQMALTILNRDIGKTFVQRQDFSGASAVQFVVPTDAAELVFELSNISSAGNTDLAIQFGQSNAIVSAAASYAWSLAAGVSFSNSNSDTKIKFISWNSTIVNLGGSFTVQRPNETGPAKTVAGLISIMNSGGQGFAPFGGSFIANANPIDLVQVIPTGATTISGTIRMYKQGPIS